MFRLEGIDVRVTVTLCPRFVHCPPSAIFWSVCSCKRIVSRNCPYLFISFLTYYFERTLSIYTFIENTTDGKTYSRGTLAIF